MAKTTNFRIVTISKNPWYRVHRFSSTSGNYGPLAFNSSGLGNARFSPLLVPDTDDVIPTLYAVDTLAGAVAEVLLHDIPEPSAGYIHDWGRDRMSDLCMSTIALPKLRLANLTSTGLRAAALTQADLFAPLSSRYPAARLHALNIWRDIPAAQGLCWMSVGDNRSMALMLFGDRVAAGDMTLIDGPTPIAAYEQIVFALLDELGCGLIM